MARKRVIYSAQAAFVDTTQLLRVQSASHSFNIPRTDVTIYGKLAPIDRMVLESPTVSFETSYLVIGTENEAALGFSIGADSAIADMLTGTAGEKNYYVITTPEGTDATDGSGGTVESQYGIGNGFITNWSVRGAVGEFATASVSVEALNMVYGTVDPTIDPEDGTPLSTGNITLTTTEEVTGINTVMAIRPGDITLDLTDIDDADHLGAKLVGTGAAHVQNFSIDLNLTREPLQRLGSKFAFAREPQFPIPVTLSITANVNEIKDGNLANIVNACSTGGKNVSVTLKDCDGDIVVVYSLFGVTLDESSFDGSVGPSESVTITFTCYVGGPNDTLHNFKISNTA